MFSSSSLAKLSMQQWADLARAGYELAVARWRLSRWDVSRMLAIENAGPSTPAATPTAKRFNIAKRTAFAIPRVGSRVPWRADCLVQALAARRWLSRHGIDSEIHVGVRKAPGVALDAHAWLTCGDMVVTGGDVSGYVPLVAAEVSAALRHTTFAR